MAGKDIGGILIVEAGSTKTDWGLVRGGECSRWRTSGMNPASMPKEMLLSVALSARDMMGEDAACVKSVRYYGAGVIGPSLPVLDSVLKNVFEGVTVAYGSDLLAAAESMLGDRSGIACILGTGSGCGLYDGQKIISVVRPGGYVLGDEGGGSALGKAFLADYVKGLVPEEVLTEFKAQYGELSYGEIVEKVYRGDSPAGYLASFAPFVLSCRGHDYADMLIDNNLRSFITRLVMPCARRVASEAGAPVRVAVAGSVGLECRGELISLGRQYGLDFFRFEKSPIEGLISALTGKNN